MTQPKQATGGVTWHVTAQNEGMGRLPTGQFAQGVNISFLTSNGMSGNVFVPNADYTPEKVRQAIHDRVSMMHSVGGLTGQVG